MTGYKPSALRLVAAFAALYVLWGSNFLAIRYAAAAMPPFLMMAVRSLIAGALLFAWARMAEGVRPTRGEWPAAAAVGTVLFLGCHGLLAWAEQTVPSGVAALVLATVPVWMTLLAWAAGLGRPHWRSGVGMALSLAGLLVLIGPAPGASTPVAGLLGLVVSAFAWAAGSILSGRLRRPASLVLASGMQLMAGGSALAVVGLALGEGGRLNAAILAPRPLLAFGYMVVASSLIGFTAYMWLLRVAPPDLVGTYAFVNPVVALLVGWAMAGESLTARTLCASLVIVAGVALIVTNKTQDKGGAHDRARMEGDDASRPVGGVSGVPEADGRPSLPQDGRQPGSPHPATGG
jgi:drug/metabolite transporter (DMT)-like permease